MSGNGQPAGEEGDGADRRAPHGSDVREREGLSARVCKVEENTPFGKYANAAWAEWAKWIEQVHGGPWVKRPDRTSFVVEKTDK
jgi:hypothetical protein